MNEEGTGIAGLEGATVGVAQPIADEPRRRRGPNETVILVLFFLVSLGSVGYLLYHEEHRLVHDPNAKAERGEIVGITGDSLASQANFTEALQKIDGKLGTGDVITSLRLSPVRVDVTAHDPKGNQRIISVDPSFDVTTRDFAQSDDPGVRIRAIDTAAPTRLFTTVSQRANAEPKSLDYFVYSASSPGGAEWLLYLKDVAIADKSWQANSRGLGAHRLSEPSPEEAARQRCLQNADSAEEAARCQQ